MAEELDVLILGAGLSGINAAYRVRTELPNASLAVLEGRDILGGTWSFWKYPGFRCDAAMTNFGFNWHPWTHERKIIEGERIIEYVEDAVRTHGLDKHISLRPPHPLRRLGLGDGALDRRGRPRRSAKALPRRLHAALHRLLLWWPQDLDYAGKNVVIVGSGATTWTLFPTMAETAASVTVLQRSPSYVFALPSASPFDALLRRLLPLWLAHRLAAAKDLLLEVLFVGFLLTFPSAARSFLAKEATRQLPPGYPVDVHFNPSYKPWEQRLCISPDGDVFRALHRPNAEIVTDHIDAVVADGVPHAPPARHLAGRPSPWGVYGHMRAHRYRARHPRRSTLDAAERKGRAQAARHGHEEQLLRVARNRLPMSMERGPWYARKNIVKDKAALWFGDVTTGIRYDGGKVKSV
ncbi:phenylacetone monooxygenase [Verticillium alfalfae VaMs.102]|uniref:Phenylacetone monooxygenase n=1 Tax=Verticillium alfalfae (strain VaMs.102 / ATCC MYA-4576 / FGSC 10136) TaxID=526221 RepID=C9SYB5_VERA1|nr:phenylacetone monooxygenase [Verticillium alfalfae VaMs.102]EEY23780.1 phenylacetone monooxygenase [Verticillium alfalfae VaMs.102]